MRTASCAIIKLGFTDNDARRRASAGVVRTRRTCECFCIARQRFQHDHLSMGLVSRKRCDDEIRSRPIAAIHYDSFWNRRSMKHV